MIAWVAFILALLFFLVLGVVATFWTEPFRSYWIRQSERHSGEFHWELIGRRVRRPEYSRELRFVGIVSLAAAVFCIWILISPKA
jgi:hypothetical protein